MVHAVAAQPLLRFDNWCFGRSVSMPMAGQWFQATREGDSCSYLGWLGSVDAVLGWDSSPGSHPSLIRRFAAGTTDNGQLWMVLQPFTAEAILGRGYTPDRSNPGYLLEQLAGLIEAAQVHDRGSYAANARPSMVVADAHQLRLIPVSLLRALALLEPIDSTVAGPAFVAPELLASAQAPDECAQVYTFGALAWWLLTGSRPSPASLSDLKHASRITASLRQRSEQLGAITRPMIPVLQAALAQERSHRYQRLSEFADDLYALAADRAPHFASRTLGARMGGGPASHSAAGTGSGSGFSRGAVSGSSTSSVKRSRSASNRTTAKKLNKPPGRSNTAVISRHSRGAAGRGAVESSKIKRNTQRSENGQLIMVGGLLAVGLIALLAFALTRSESAIGSAPVQAGLSVTVEGQAEQEPGEQSVAPAPLDESPVSESHPSESPVP